jgi:hypothetical protein
VLERWEAADKDPTLVADGALNVVVVGGGPTGVESAGALAELYRGVLAQDYPHVQPDHARVTLVEAGPQLFAMFKSDIRKYTLEVLEKLGVEVLVGERVASVTPTRVTLASGTVLEAHTLVWGATGSRSAPTSAWRNGRTSSRSATSPGSPTRSRTRPCRSWDRSRCSRARPRARTSHGASRARTRNRSATTTRARWRRSGAALPSCSSTAGGR